MGNVSRARALEVRRVTTVRLGAYTSSLALLTALGLFFLAGIRGIESWSWFIVATLGGMAGVAWSIRSALGPDVVALEPSVTPAPPDLAPSPETQSHPDEVNYLMALRHEFRTPLNAVLGFSDVLLNGIDGSVNDSQREDLQIIRGSGIRLRILLDTALDLSQLAGADLRLDTERVDMRDLVARVAVEAAQLWSNKRTARCTLTEEACVADVDEARVRRSILILADFLATEHRNANIQLSLAVSGEHLAIEVSASPSDRVALGAIPTPAEALASEDAAEIRRWPVAVTSEVIARHGGSLYHGDAPARFLIRLPLQSER